MQHAGFIYLWRDSSNGMFYLGSHYGTPDDGYVGSGVRFKRAYASRPECFRRRIIEYVDGDRAALWAVEQRWLDLIKPDELNVRYYNQRRRAMGRPEGPRLPRKATPETLAKMRQPKPNKENYSKPKSAEHRRKLAEHLARVKTNPAGRDARTAKRCQIFDSCGQLQYDGMSVQTWCEEQGMVGAEIYLRDSARKGGITINRNENMMRSHGATDDTIAAYHSVKGWRAMYPDDLADPV